MLYLIVDLEKVFKNLIIAQAVVLFFAIVSAFSMPKDLLEISEYVPAGIYGTEFGAVLSILLLLGYAISLVMLYRYVIFAKKFYITLIIIGFILDLAGEAMIMTSITYSLGSLHAMIVGAILALLFFSPIKDKFK